MIDFVDDRVGKHLIKASGITVTLARYSVYS